MALHFVTQFIILYFIEVTHCDIKSQDKNIQYEIFTVAHRLKLSTLFISLLKIYPYTSSISFSIVNGLQHRHVASVSLP